MNRAAYRYSEPYVTWLLSSMRFVADLSDPDKVMARVPGGTSGPCDSPRFQDQLEPWLAGEPAHWWFSDREILRQAVSKLGLRPSQRGEATR